MRELTPDIIRTLTADQIELLIELGDLARKEGDLTAQIDSIRRQEEKVGLARNSKVNRAVHEDSTYVDLVSVRFVRERSVIREQIAGILRSLIHEGLSDLGIVARQAANYGVQVKE
jgi:hypothetical protein